MQRQFLFMYFQCFLHVPVKVSFCTLILPLCYCHLYMGLCFMCEMLATLVLVGEALLLPLPLHGLAGVYLKR